VRCLGSLPRTKSTHADCYNKTLFFPIPIPFPAREQTHVFRLRSNMAVAEILANHPAKGLWTVGALVINAIKLPFWIIYYISSSTRQHTRWNLRQAVATNSLRTALGHFLFMRVSMPLAVKLQAKERGLLVTIPPSTKQDTYGGICNNKQIKPTIVCGY
jgi:hypothetical protein